MLACLAVFVRILYHNYFCSDVFFLSKYNKFVATAVYLEHHILLLLKKANTSSNIKVGTPNQSFKGNRKMEAEGLRTLVKFFTVSFCSMDAYHALDNFSFT